jgi:superfamily II DNA/RNA helicase
MNTTPSFLELGVPAVLAEALAAQGIDAPFPIQEATLPHSLAGHDVLGRGRTGSGKTYAFVLPVLARLAAGPSRRRSGRPRALILAPTRELVSQIEASIAPLAKALSLRTVTIFGGVSANPQVTALRDGVDIVVACPGRLTDHLQQGNAKLDAVEITVLDEADHMADLGFLPAVKKLLEQTPRTGQRLLFSATLDAGVDVLVKRFMTNPITHSVDSAQSPVEAMTHHVLHVHQDSRLPVLVDLTAAPGRTLVFTRTKHRAKTLTKQLNASGIPAVELHGNLGQTARTRNLLAFSDGSAKTMVATDIAARGIHVDDVTLVIHADPPVEHKAYLHRSGRTARAGASGTVVTLMTDEQVSDVRDLTRKAGIKPTTTRIGPGHPLLVELAPGERVFSAAPVRPPVVASQPKQPRRTAAPKNGAPKSGSGRGGGGGRGGSARRGGGRNGAAVAGAGQGGSARGGSAARGGGSGRGGSTPVHSTSTGGSAGGRSQGQPAKSGGRGGAAPTGGGRGQSGGASTGRGGAAAFSSGTRAGGRRGGR